MSPVSNRKLGIAFQNLSFKPGHFALLPEARTMHHPIQEWASVSPLTALQRPWNANKFCLKAVGAYSHHGIPMTAHIDKRQIGAAEGVPQAADAPSTTAISRKERRVMEGILLFPLKREALIS
jgi:hypothetical protein